MHRGFRFRSLACLLAAAALVGTASSALAQSNVVAPPPPPREGTVGPEQLRDFSLGGGNRQGETPPAEQPPAATPRIVPPPVVEDRQPPVTARQAQSSAGAQRAPAPASTGQDRPPEAAPTIAQAPSAAASDLTLGLPPATPAEPSPFDFGSAGVGSATPTEPVPAVLPTEDRPAPLWPWLLAFAALLGAGLFWWSRRGASPAARLDGSTLAFAGGPSTEPRPPALRPQPPAPPRAAPAPSPQQPAPTPVPSHPKGVGIVSSRLRPWLDVEVGVAGAVLSEDELQLQLHLLVSNTGSTPARQVGVEVVALNAGPDQDKDLASYFARPDPEPRAAEMIAPLDQAVLQTTVRMPRSTFREYAAGGGRVVVPIVAVTASYRAGSSSGRTSAAFLIGRATAAGEKLGPLRTDQGPREYRGLVARPLSGGVRR